ncbi:MAG TPA: BREX-2 system adenine-specific DNA-methyltransferase PglX, partial [Actinomycetes bacterium]|nr:BREX-2 system adenine-specific DNA-methyltransferase PglX [Actinomycetes bacterium]
MSDPAALLADTKSLVRLLVEDLRTLTGSDTRTAAVVDAEYAGAKAAKRTALGKAEWAEGLYALVAVAWVLGCVFVRFCEDNGLVPDPLLAGPGGRRAIAIDHRTAYVQAHPAHDDRHWLREIFRIYRTLPATGEIFGDHNPIWLLAPSADGARSLVQGFQAVDPDTGEIRHDFTDPAWDTRFLGDLYQDLSEHAKKTYALLQTPEFVEEFILDRTLDPALATFGLREITLIDPTCGSGHFLLGAFARLFDRWRDEEPGTNRRVLAARALDAIAGVDLNPFAAAIARFRLLVAALRAGGDTRLADAPAYPIHVAVGDSLLHGDPPGRLAGTLSDDVTAAALHGYATEDVEMARGLLSRSWHVVVGNPPYITVKDPALNRLYRERFKTCHRQYSLGVPFTERFFQLARYADRDPEQAGFVGMITANSFMKREFGKKLIEEWVPTHDLTHVIDTSGAEIPGHKTPTVILLGRNRRPVAPALRVVMGIRGEYPRPTDPEKGLVWSSIVELIDEPGSSSGYVSVVDLQRARLAKHPWSIGGGGAAELKELLDLRGSGELGGVVAEIGFGAVTREDDAFRIGQSPALRAGVSSRHCRPLVAGDEIRDWRISELTDSIWPYAAESLNAESEPAIERFLWPWRKQLSERVAYGKTQLERGLNWWEYSMFFRRRFHTLFSIAFAFVATHNHFVLDHGGKVFNRSA